MVTGEKDSNIDRFVQSRLFPELSTFLVKAAEWPQVHDRLQRLFTSGRALKDGATKLRRGCCASVVSAHDSHSEAA